MNAEKPTIKCFPNGPYFIKKDAVPEVMLNIPGADGDTTTSGAGVALCRCGGSKNKPYCDGSHSNNGFSDKKLADDSLDRRDTYIGAQITIHDNRGICAHAGLCTNQLADVFKLGEEPWIDADGASLEAIIDVICSCPSGALSYSIDNREHQDQQQNPVITVIKNGPYSVSGDIDVVDQAVGDGASARRYTLCRCGASRNKPYCDGSHWDIGFKDEEQ